MKNRIKPHFSRPRNGGFSTLKPRERQCACFVTKLVAGRVLFPVPRNPADDHRVSNAWPGYSAIDEPYVADPISREEVWT